MTISSATTGADERLGRVQSLVRAFGVLDVLASHHEGLGLTDVAKFARLPRSTAHRMLCTMDSLGHVQFSHATGRWSIGVKAFEVGCAFGKGQDFAQLGRPVMRALLLKERETVSISISGGSTVRFVGQVEAEGADLVPARTGKELPLHTTAAGKALMAFWRRDELDSFLLASSLQRLTRSSITAANQLSQELCLVQRRGYSVDDGETSENFRCVGAPVFGFDGRPVAALSISGRIGHLPDRRIEHVGNVLVAAAARLTERIGGRRTT